MHPQTIDPRLYSAFVEHLGNTIHGGNYVCTYQWEDSVGPVESRPVSLDDIAAAKAHVSCRLPTYSWNVLRINTSEEHSA